MKRFPIFAPMAAILLFPTALDLRAQEPDAPLSPSAPHDTPQVVFNVGEAENPASDDNAAKTPAQPQPLWIVDGVMFDTFEAAGISKDDIKSVSVLKDSPLYGERGANGVVIVSTKTEPRVPFVTMPQFEGGGLNTFRAWVEERIVSPGRGHAVLTFVVDKEGCVTDINILKTPGKKYSQEVIRVMESAPRWIPGSNNGEKSNVKYTLYVNFPPKTK